MLQGLVPSAQHSLTSGERASHPLRYRVDAEDLDTILL